MLLLGLALAESRRLPPGLALLLVPYLALMAGHWIGHLLRRRGGVPWKLRESPAGSPDGEDLGTGDEPSRPDDPPDEVVAAGPDARPEGGDSSRPAPASPPDGLPTSEPRRARTRRRQRIAEAGPQAASWVQVQPGRFVRVEEMPPEPANDEHDGGQQPGEPDEAQGAGSSAEADAETPGPGPEPATEVEEETMDGVEESGCAPEGRGEGPAEWEGSPDRRADAARGGSGVDLPQAGQEQGA